MGKPSFPEVLRNRYWVLRHGTSEANKAGLIVSNPGNGIGAWGLTALGRGQVAVSVMRGRDAGVFKNGAFIYSSDFLRARQSADIASKMLGGTVAKNEPLLRERDFGDFELTTSANYQRVWQEDRIDPTHCQWHVESATAVTERLAECILRMESRYSQATLLLVAHGDVLQILQCAFEGVSPSEHRQLPPLEVAELREYKKQLF